MGAMLALASCQGYMHKLEQGGILKDIATGDTAKVQADLNSYRVRHDGGLYMDFP